MWPAVGSWVEVELFSEGTRLTGQVFQVEKSVGVAILMEPVVPEDYDSLPIPLRPAVLHTVRTLSLAAVKSVKEISRETKFELPSVKPVKVERLLRREQRALHKRQSQFGSRAPSGTSQEAMNIFEALSKTDGDNDGGKRLGNEAIIVVMEEVYVCPPYTVSGCRGTIKSNPALVERVKKVLEGERKRLGLDK